MVGLVTRCVLLLLYGSLLHHQNIKCPVGKRACAWVHPHFTFTADCRLNRATFPRFLAPENVPRTTISNPLPPNAVTGTLLPFLLHLPAKFTPFVIPWILFDHIVTNLGEISLYRISAVCFADIFTWKSRQLSTNLAYTCL